MRIRDGVHQRPSGTSISRAVDAPKCCARIQRGRDFGIDGQRGDGPLNPGPGTCCCPGLTTVRGAKDTAAVGTGVEGGRREGINNKLGDILKRVGETHVQRCPVIPTVRGTEKAAGIVIGTGIQGGRREGVDSKRRDRPNGIGETSVYGRPDVATICGPEDAIIPCSNIQGSGSLGIDSERCDNLTGDAGVRCAPGRSIICRPGDAILGPGVQCGRCQRIDGERTLDLAIRSGTGIGVHRDPVAAAVRRTINAAITVTRIQGCRGEKIDGQRPDLLLIDAEPRIRRCPVVTAVCRAKEAAAVRTCVEGGRCKRINGKTGDPRMGRISCGDPSIHRFPVVTTVCRAEDTTAAGTSVEGGRSIGIDNKSPDLSPVYYCRPDVATVRGAEDTIQCAGIQRGRRDRVDSEAEDVLIRTTSFTSHGKPSVCRCPCVTAVYRTEDATAVATGVECGRGERINGKTGDRRTRGGETSVQRCPCATAVYGAEDLAASAGIQGGGGLGVDSKNRDRTSIEW